MFGGLLGVFGGVLGSLAAPPIRPATGFPGSVIADFFMAAAGEGGL